MVTISEIRNAYPDNSLTGDELLVTDKSLGGETKSPKLGNSSVSAAGATITEYVKDYIEKEGLQNIDINANSLGVSSLNTTTTGNHTGTLDSKAISLVPFNNQANTFSSAQTFNAGIIATTGQFSGTVNSNSGFTINGTPVGTSTDTYWVAEGDGGVSYGDYIDPAEIKTAQLTAIDKIVASSASIVDVFIYDTSKDSDGGAWREKCANLSWYNETLNTATRGKTRKFPAKALIVSTTTQVIIYDITVPEVPMWIVFNGAGSWPMIPNNYFGGGTNIHSSSFALNGCLYTTDTSAALITVDFIKDAGTMIGTAEYIYNGNISQRNLLTYGFVVLSGRQVVSSVCNQVVAKVLPNAPIDAITGLPIATVLVATNSGISQINPDGSIWDCTDHGSYKINSVSFTDDLKIAFDMSIISGNNDSWNYIIDLLTADTATNTKTAIISANSVASPTFILPKSFDVSVVANIKDIFGFSGAGIVKLFRASTIGSSLQNYITTLYNTGWLAGDIRGAWLSSNVAESITGVELVTNGTFDTDISGWTEHTTNGGTATVSIVSGKVRIATISGNYGIYQAINVTIGKQYRIMLDFASGTSTDRRFRLGNSIFGSEYLDINAGTIVGYSLQFIPTAATVYISIINSASGTYVEADNISARTVSFDRSVKANGLLINGTLTTSAVATGAELMAYSGFSATNNLTAASNANWDVITTGSAYLSAWFKCTGNSAIEDISGFSNAANNIEFRLRIDADGKITGVDDGATAEVLTTSGIAQDNSLWHKADFVRTSSTARALYIDGILVASNTTDAGSLTGTGTLPFAVGVNPDGSSNPATTTSLTLAKISATAPTAAQIKKMYEDEKFLFQDNAKCCLSKSNTVQDLAYDEENDIYYVATADGTDVFSGLTRVEYIDLAGTPTNDNVKAVSAVNGTYALGTGAEAVVNEPAKNIREELAEAKEKELPKVGISLNDDGETEHANKERFKDDVEFEGDVEIEGGLTATRTFQIADNPQYPDKAKLTTGTDSHGVAKIYNGGTVVVAAASSGDIVLKIIDNTYFTSHRIREKFTALLVANTVGNITTSRGSQILQISGSVIAGNWTDLTVDVISSTVKGFISAQTWAISLSGTAPGTILLTTTITNSHSSATHHCSTTIYGDVLYGGHG